MVENGGNRSKAMKEAGYSDNTAKNPKKLTDSKGFRELMDSYLPDDLLLEALKTDIEQKIGKRKAELELAFRLKNKFKDNPDDTLIVNLLPVPILGGGSHENDKQEQK